MSFLTNSDKEWLLSAGYLQEDLPQIDEACEKTKYSLFTEGNIDKEKKITRAKVISLLPRETFLSGIGRSAFHWSAAREIPDSDQRIYFDSSRLFR